MASTTTTADFERIYRRHARDVYRFALSVVRNPLEAEDVTQTTFLNAFRALERGDRPERPRSWLFAIAHNAIRSRDRWTLRRPQEVPLDVAEHRLAAQPDDPPAVDDLFRALGDLPDAQREAIALRELQGQTYPEIAEVLGVSVSAVESLIGRARRALRAQRDRIGAIALLRRLCEHGDGGVAAKACAVAAAAAALAGGMAVETHVAGAPPVASAATSRQSESQSNAVATHAAVAAAAVAVARVARPAVRAPRSAHTVAPSAVGVATTTGSTPPPAPVTTAPAGVASPTASVPESVPAPAAATTAQSAVTTAATTAAAAASTTVTVPPVTEPAATVPAATVPAVTVPAVPTPALTTPPLTTPALTTPALTTPSVTLPAPPLP
jgi:RNA polymerase sigma factor (sigma-70 family)